MFRKILGGILALWGAAVLINHFVSGKSIATSDNAAYQGGATAALFMAALFILGGISMIFYKKPEEKK